MTQFKGNSESNTVSARGSVTAENFETAAAANAMASPAAPVIPEALPEVAEKSNSHRMLGGPLAAVVTHYNRDLSLDLGALKENLRYLVDNGIRTGNGSILVGGAAGDFDSLSVQERRTLVETAAAVLSGKVPLIVGAQSTDLRVVIQMAEIADEVGAYAIQVSPPYYHEHSDEDVLRWYRSVADSLRKSGIMVYNTYWHGYNFPLDVLDQVVELERVVSLKWATPSGGFDFENGITRYAKRIALVDNNLTWPLTFLFGGTTFVTLLGTVWPQFATQLYGLFKAGKYRAAAESMEITKFPWMRFKRKVGARTGGESPAVRAALEICGRPGGPSRPPSRDLNQEERSELRDILQRIGAPIA